MIELQATERYVINQLLDHQVFTTAIAPRMPTTQIDAINSVKQRSHQQRISAYCRNLLGVIPEYYQANLLLLFGPGSLNADEVHVLLATLKAVINLPDIQDNKTGQVVETKMIINQVYSEATNLSEKVIFCYITQLFVDRFKLFKPDLPENAFTDEEVEVNEYWDISPDFVLVAQAIVNSLLKPADVTTYTDQQQVNRALLKKRFLSPTTTPSLWAKLVSNKPEIATQWQSLGRFDLECGDDYALLLDRNRQLSTARPFMIAIAVAHSLGEGFEADQLTSRIRLIARQLYPENMVNPSAVKEMFWDNSLAYQTDGFVVPTPLADRFQVRTPREDD